MDYVTFVRLQIGCVIDCVRVGVESDFGSCTSHNSQIQTCSRRYRQYAVQDTQICLYWCMGLYKNVARNDGLHSATFHARRCGQKTNIYANQRSVKNQPTLMHIRMRRSSCTTHNESKLNAFGLVAKCINKRRNHHY